MKLLLENWREYINEVSMGFDMAKTNNPRYTGFILDDTSHQKLAQLAPEGWRLHSHHITLIPPTKGEKPGDPRLRLPSHQLAIGHNEDQKVCLKVIGIAQNEKVIAVSVDPKDLERLNIYHKMEGVPHITIATAIWPERTKRPEKPVYHLPTLANEFSESDFQRLPAGPIEVCGKVEEVAK